MTIKEFPRIYPTKEEREDRLKTMSNNEIDEIIKLCVIVQAKIYYSKFKKGRSNIWHVRRSI